MTSKKVIAVFGATGAQGGSVVRALVQSGRYSVRAVTRNANSDKARQLATLNDVTVVEADLDNPSSLDKVLQGAYGTFLVTDYSAHMFNKEIQQGKDAIDSALRNGIKHFIFSGLENLKSMIGKPVDHFDFKAEIENYGFSLNDKINFTSIRLPGYYENFNDMALRKADSNLYYVNYPIGDRPGYHFSVDDIGPCVLSLFDAGEEYRGKVVPVAGDCIKLEDIVAILNKHLTPIKFINSGVTVEQFAKFGFPGAVELANMFEAIQTGKMVRDINLTKKLNRDTHDFESWLVKNKETFLRNLK